MCYCLSLGAFAGWLEPFAVGGEVVEDPLGEASRSCHPSHVFLIVTVLKPIVLFTQRSTLLAKLVLNLT